MDMMQDLLNMILRYGKMDTMRLLDEHAIKRIKEEETKRLEEE